MSNERQPGHSTYFPAKGTADATLVWPPPPEDLAACLIVPLDGVAEFEALPPPPLPSRRVEPPALPARPPAVQTFFEARTTAQLKDARPTPRAFDGDETTEEADSAGDVKQAWVALALAVGCLIVTVATFRTARDTAGAPPIAPATAEAGERVAQPAGSPARPADAARPAIDAGGDWPDLLLPLYVGRVHRAPPPQRPPPRQLAPPPRAPVRATYTRATPSPRPVPPAARPASPPPQSTASAIRQTPPAAAPAPMAPSSRPPTNTTTVASAAPPPARPEPTPPASAPAPRNEPAPVTAVVADAGPVVDDEADIQSTLRRFRAAYSTLNARAAREVWPSVDVRALEKAFDSVKSQELRFDRCDLKVTGARARAACTGRAVYVPRVGGSSPRSTSREWTFELTKSDQQRWTIASFRSS